MKGGVVRRIICIYVSGSMYIYIHVYVHLHIQEAHVLTLAANYLYTQLQICQRSESAEEREGEVGDANALKASELQLP